MNLRVFFLRSLFALVCSIELFAPVRSYAQTVRDSDRKGAVLMLQTIQHDLKDYYYDPTFHGMDIEHRFKEAETKIKQSQSYSQILATIAQVVLELNDSHTTFIPPNLAIDVEYGWSMQVIGDRCYVTRIKAGSDAEAKGLKVGDEIYSIDGYNPTRENLWKIRYTYYKLRPKERVNLEVIGINGESRQLEIIPSAKQRPKTINLDIAYYEEEKALEEALKEPDFKELGSELIIWKMRSFMTSEDYVDKMMARLRQHKNAILDLRGNPGGYERILIRMASYFFDRDIKVSVVKRRKETKQLLAKSRGEKAFSGQLVVLVDSRSASAAEEFARLIQLEKRGTVVGDRTAGMVTEAMMFPHVMGNNLMVGFSTSITIAEVTMSDGHSLEHIGVTPDEIILPTNLDLHDQCDPVLSRAASLVGAQLDPKTAGTLFPPPKDRLGHQ